MVKQDNETKQESPDDMVNVLMGETCPACGQKALSLSEHEQDIPYFGKIALFSMTCKKV